MSWSEYREWWVGRHKHSLVSWSINAQQRPCTSYIGKSDASLTWSFIDIDETMRPSTRSTPDQRTVQCKECSWVSWHNLSRVPRTPAIFTITIAKVDNARGTSSFVATLNLMCNQYIHTRLCSRFRHTIQLICSHQESSILYDKLVSTLSTNALNLFVSHYRGLAADSEIL